MQRPATQYGIRKNGARRNLHDEVSITPGAEPWVKGLFKVVAFIASKWVLFAVALEAHLKGSEMRPLGYIAWTS